MDAKRACQAALTSKLPGPECRISREAQRFHSAAARLRHGTLLEQGCPAASPVPCSGTAIATPRNQPVLRHITKVVPRIKHRRISHWKRLAEASISCAGWRSPMISFSPNWWSVTRANLGTARHGPQLLPSHRPGFCRRGGAAGRQGSDLDGAAIVTDCEQHHQESTHSLGPSQVARNLPAAHEKANRGLKTARAKLLPVLVFSGYTFTVPANYGPIDLGSPISGAGLRSVAGKQPGETIDSFARRRPAKLKGQIGAAVAVLHTHNRKLYFHPIASDCAAGACESAAVRNGEGLTRSTHQYRVFNAGPTLAKVFPCKWLRECARPSGFCN